MPVPMFIAIVAATQTGFNFTPATVVMILTSLWPGQSAVESKVGLGPSRSEANKTIAVETGQTPVLAENSSI